MNKRSTLLSVLATGAMALLAGCATPMADPGAMVSAPDGTVTTFHRKSSGSYGNFDGQVVWAQRAVQWQGRSVVSVGSPEAGSTYYDATTHGVLAAFNAAGQQTYAYTPPVGFAFPLAVGKAWTGDHKMTVVARNTVVPMKVDYKVQAYESVTVPAGTFMAFKTVYTDSFGETTQQWSVPSQGIATLKRISERSASHPLGAGQLQAELLSVKRP